MNFVQKYSPRIGSILLMSVLPIVTLAAGVPTDGSSTSSGSYCSGFTGSLDLSNNTLTGVIKFMTCFLTKAVVPLLFALAVAAFVYGVFDFIRANASGEETGEKKAFMVWGIIGLAVMLSVWGLVGILQNTFHVGNVIPQLPVNSQ